MHGQSAHVLVYKDGRVNVLHDGRGDYTFICNLNTECQGVSVEFSYETRPAN